MLTLNFYNMILMKKILRTFLFVAMLGGIVSIATSCNDDESEHVDYGTVTGIVLDEMDAPISGVTVTISGVDETVTTGSDGKYTAQNVSIDSHSVKFSKKGFQTISVTITAGKFDANKVASTSVKMVNADSKIVGTLTDAKNGGAPLAGVVVSISADVSATSGSDGKFVIEDLVKGTYTVTFTKTDYVTITKTVKESDFVDGVATLDLRMGGVELLRGLTAEDLATADKWYYNEYRGGRNGDAYPHWDWSGDYMCALDLRGAWDEQNEGTTLQIRNSGDERNNPANLDVFDSFVYGSKKITEDNKILSLRVRTHDADEASPAYFGVQVIDLSAAEPTNVKIGDTKTHGSGNYADYDFDLSAYVGKEVIVAVGIYRQKTGDYWKQLVLRAIRFADKKVENWDWLPGTDVVDGWKLTQEMVRSTMVHPKKSFSGISKVSGGRDNYKAAYRSWRENSHIAFEWAFVPLHKDPEVFPSEGYLIKTRGSGTAVNTKEPEAYFYSKFAIGAGNNQLTLKTRTFGGNYTFFKLTAIKEDGTVVHVAPKSNTAQEASAAADGCWKFKHGAGGAGEPEAYASFVYDLSQFNGNNVVLVFGVYKGESNGDESKLVFYSINLN